MVGNGRCVSEAVKPTQLVVARDWVSATGEVNVGEEGELLDAEDVFAIAHVTNSGIANTLRD